MSAHGDIQGRWMAMTACSPIPRYWSRWLKLYWWMLKPLEHMMKWRVGRWVIAHAPLLKDVASLTALSMISFARWSILEKGARREKNYLLFETNFNGDHDSYLEAFSLVVPTSMRLTWKIGPLGGYGIPDVGKVSKFLRYVNENERRPIFGYYSAYPNASTKMVRAALSLRPRVEKFDEQFRDKDVATFLSEYRTLLGDVQNIRNPEASPAGEGATGALSVMAPVLEDKDGLMTKLDSLSRDPRIPTDRTHFARWILVELESAPYLLFSAWFDYRREDGEEQGQEQYVKVLHGKLAGMESIWQHCGFRDTSQPDLFWRDIRSNRVRLGIPFYGYEGVTVKEVREALEWADTFEAFTTEYQGREASDLRREWRSIFPIRRVPFRERRGVPARVEEHVAA